ncbi:lipopolysaccharide biosynthesis protein [Lactobacillus sp. CBA3606]|uniref:lipopolysaccharide biosynthesis protein n=1 Tax=Lactobacillus sp. CBA3606 TaxID=2099789 RepID=UPI001319C7BB|nr:oligosaccharide flippase family protein [Lactobacillus sp. CBA3606]
MNTRGKRLLGNSMLFAISNLGSKLLNFIMVPFYTRTLTTAEFGSSDLITTIVNLLIPIITLSISDAVFRFTMEKSNDPHKVLTNGFAVSLISLLIVLLISPLFHNIPYISVVLTLTFLGAITAMLQEFSRSIGHVKIFAMTGIIITLGTVISNVLLLFVYHFGLMGYLASMIIAQLIGFIYLFNALRAWRYIRISAFSPAFIKIMLAFSIPLIPNTLSWWLASASSRLFVVSFVGVAANGLYAVANKIPSLITMLYTIFMQAWQMSAVEEYKSKDNSQYYSIVFNLIIQVLLVGVSSLIVFDKVILRIIASPSYFSAWTIVPWLAMAVMYISLSSFLGTTYIAAFATRGIFYTTVLGAIFNVILNFALVPFFGTIGAAVGSMIAFLAIAIIRLHDTKKIIKIVVNYPLLIKGHLILVFQIMTLYLTTGMIQSVLFVISFSVMLVLNRKLLISCYGIVRGLIWRKK